MNINKVFAGGRLGRDPELRYTQSGKAVANFSIACSSYLASKEKETEWFNVVAWEKNAEFASENLRKGARVLVVGRQQTRKWTDKSGAQKTTVELVAENIQVIDWPNGDQAAPAYREEQREEHPAFDAGDDDIPF
jgi:single-strand DNA-binding protein